MNLNEAEDYMRRCDALHRKGLSEHLTMQLKFAEAWELLRDLEQADEYQIARMNRLDAELRGDS